MFRVNMLLAVCLLFIPAPAQAQRKKDKDKPIRVDMTGLVLKAIVKTSDARLLESPGGKVIQEPEPFTIFTRLYAADGSIKDEAKGKEIFYRVGDLDNRALGWIKKADVVDWDTRFVLTPKANTKFTVYGKKKASDPEPRSDEDLAKMDRIAERDATPPDQTAMAPILGKPLDSRDPAYRIAFLTARSFTATSKTVRPRVETRDIKLEVMFVVDTTASMTPLLEGTKEIVRQIAAGLAANPALKGKVRLGLVEYQDLVKGLVPARMVSKLTDDFATFQKALKPLKEAKVGSEDAPEDVLAGLKMAIDEAGWAKESSKHIVLLGDASAQLNEAGKRNAKNTTNQSIEGIIALARTKAGGEGEKQMAQVTFHAVLAKSDDPIDRKRAQEHFRKIASNNNEVKGLYRWVENPNKKDDQNAVIQEVVKVLRDGFDILARGGKGTLKMKDEDVQGPVAQSVWRLFKTLNTRGNEVVFNGYGAERNEKGEQIALRKVFVTKTQLERLVSTLDFLNKNLEALVDPEERKDVTGVLYVIQAAAAGTTSGQAVKVDSKLGEFISALPLKTDALRVTPKQLSGFTEKQYRDWLNKLREARTLADNLIRRPQSQWQVIERPGGKKEQMNFFLLGELP